MIRKPHNAAIAAITESPRDAITIGQSYFDRADKVAQQQYGGVVVNSMLDAAQSFSKTDHQHAFTTTMQAVNLANNTGDSDALRTRGFEQMGAIIGNYSVINEKSGAQMRKAAQSTAAIHGTRFEEALRRGEAQDKLGYKPEPQATPQAAAEPVAPTPQADGRNNSDAGGNGRRQTAAEPTSKAGKLTDVGAQPMAAPQQPGLMRRIGSGLWTTAKWGVAAVAIIAGAQYTSVKLGNDASWSIFGVRAVSDQHYRDLKADSGFLRAAQAGFGQFGIPGTIGAPRAVANMDQNPHARAAAINTARQEGAEAERARLNEDAARKRGIIAPKAEDVSKAMNDWRKEHPKEFEQVLQLSGSNVSGAMIELAKTAPPELAQSMGNLLAAKGVNGFREPLFAANETRIREERAAAARTPRPASGPGSRP
ncbi:MAG: hypothetical protein KBA75_01165 [Alphaproteobacteria bacterium]|nr:hypothetical protein [Alphaproteobacteria bacterium]